MQSDVSEIDLLTGDVPALLYSDPAAGGDGSYVVNPEKSSVNFSWVPAKFNNQFPAVIPANQSVDFGLRVNPEDGLKGDLEVAAFFVDTPSRVSVQAFLPLLNKQLMNVPISSTLMSGTAQLPALLPQTLYAFPSEDWTITIADLTGDAPSVSPVVYGRRFTDRNKGRAVDPRKAQLLSKFMHVYWLGPSTATLTDLAGNVTSVAGGPEIALPSGWSATLTFPVPGDADFDCRYILDDSSSTTGAQPVLTGQIYPGEQAAPLNDVPMSWSDFLASPTIHVTGAPSGGIFRAASFPSPNGCWSNLFERSTKVTVNFVSGDAGTITLRTCFAGIAVYANAPINQQITTQQGNIQTQQVGS